MIGESLFPQSNAALPPRTEAWKAKRRKQSPLSIVTGSVGSHSANQTARVPFRFVFSPRFCVAFLLASSFALRRFCCGLKLSFRSAARNPSFFLPAGFSITPKNSPDSNRELSTWSVRISKESQALGFCRPRCSVNSAVARAAHFLVGGGLKLSFRTK